MRATELAVGTDLSWKRPIVAALRPGPELQVVWHSLSVATNFGQEHFLHNLALEAGVEGY